MNTVNTNDEMIAIKAQRELGIIEKLCSTYGFVYCCHRDGRYFFHFSEYKNDIHQAKIGGMRDRSGRTVRFKAFFLRWNRCSGIRNYH